MNKFFWLFFYSMTLVGKKILNFIIQVGIYGPIYIYKQDRERFSHPVTKFNTK